jgi:hypothetical protein
VRDLSGARPEAQETMPLTFEAPVRAADGPAGRLTDVVVDPGARSVTHLVVEGPDGQARLVPAEHLVPGRAPDGAVVLSCSSAEVADCESIRSFSLVGPEQFPHGDERADIGVEDMQVIPSFGAAEFGLYAGDIGSGYGVTYDRIPTGSAELRRGSAVVSAGGEVIGELSGLLVANGRLTDVVLRRADAIPIGSVTAIETDRITVASRS